eukprot:gene15635-23863_t
MNASLSDSVRQLRQQNWQLEARLEQLHAEQNEAKLAVSALTADIRRLEQSLEAYRNTDPAQLEIVREIIAHRREHLEASHALERLSAANRTLQNAIAAREHGIILSDNDDECPIADLVAEKVDAEDAVQALSGYLEELQAKYAIEASSWRGETETEVPVDRYVRLQQEAEYLHVQ